MLFEKTEEGRREQSHATAGCMRLRHCTHSRMVKNGRRPQIRTSKIMLLSGQIHTPLRRARRLDWIARALSIIGATAARAKTAG
eukprot:8265085-Pyramimonas_sp.AAC.1